MLSAIVHVRGPLLSLSRLSGRITARFLGRRLEETAAGATRAHGLALLLHDLADLHGCVEELGGAAVDADGLALVKLALAVVGGDALLLAGLLEAGAIGIVSLRFGIERGKTYRL